MCFRLRIVFRLKDSDVTGEALRIAGLDIQPATLFSRPGMWRILQESSSSAYDRGERRLNPLAIPVLGLNNELFTAEVPTEGIHGVVNGEGLPFVSVSLLRRVRESLRREGNGLVLHSAIFEG